MSEFNCLAFDLGAESGRLMHGGLADGQLFLNELSRFPNHAIQSGNHLYWDADALLQNVRKSLTEAAGRGVRYESISTVSWGLDYFLFKGRNILQPVFHYRDSRNACGKQRLFSKITWPELFEETGIQEMPINTSYQLAAEDPARLRGADRLLSIADGINHLLGGKAAIEETMASTFQIYNPRTRAWSRKILDALDLPGELLGPLCKPGARLGFVAPHYGNALRQTEIIATCSHDTAAAVAAIPAHGSQPGEWAYISSGTWSLLGVELNDPIITDEARDLNFTNEVGYGKTIRLLKNIIGLWLIQECRRAWEANGQRIAYDELTRLAYNAEPFRTLINVADSRFVAPGEMPARIQAYCKEASQSQPSSAGEFARAIFESLALQYRRTLDRVQRLTGTRVDRLHVVGGGCKNALLNQFTANATGVPVIAGPVEATALGNVLVQAITVGHFNSLADARAAVARSFPTTTYQPENTAGWEEAYGRFCELP
ncbi:MAG TPA: rhamnulokinase family protein [Methylomirabilota bacterium]|nr:rhamnulokinase family protein [Methylomirabilota bacterium]